MKCIILVLILVCCAIGTVIAGDITNTTRILLTGGWDVHRIKYPASILSSSSVFPSSPGCPPPSLPSPRDGHVTFTTDSGLVATCGGQDESFTPLPTCLVLEAGRWMPDPRVPDLPQPRYQATSVSVPRVGVFIMGGRGRLTSSLLLTDGSWKEGPTLPGGGALQSCSVAWGGSVFILGGRPEYYQVREYRTGSGEWEEESKWPQLGGKGRVRHGCSVLGSQLIVAGGLGWDFGAQSSTASLDLASGPGGVWLEGGRMSSPRWGHAMVTVGAAGRERLYALGGWNDGRVLNTVERWEEGGRRWEVEEERLPEGRRGMGAVAMTEDVCTA